MKPFLTIVLIALTFVSTTRVTNACSPSPQLVNKTFEDFYDDASLIVKAHVLSKTTALFYERFEKFVYKIHVRRRFKGCLPRRSKVQYLYTATSGAACGTELELGKNYMIMLQGPPVAVSRTGKADIKGFFIGLFDFHSQGLNVPRVERKYLKENISPCQR